MSATLINGAVLLDRGEFHSLLNYSTTLPTGTTEGKRWRRAVHPWHQTDADAWMMGEFGAPYPAGHEYEGQVPISWTPIVVAGVPPRWPRDVAVPLRQIARSA